MNAPVQFGKVALRGSLSPGLAGVKIGLQFLSVVVLARLLVPEDFGLVAAVGPIVAFVALFQDLGLQQAVVQRPDITEHQLNRMFWVMAGVGLVCTIVVVRSVRLSPGSMVTRACATSPSPLACLCCSAAWPGFRSSLLNRHLRFGHLATIDVANALSGFVAAAMGAWYGLGYWSLLVGAARRGSRVVGACLGAQPLDSRGGQISGRPRHHFVRRQPDRLQPCQLLRPRPRTIS